MNRGLGDNPLDRKKVEEFSGTDFNIMGFDRVLYEVKGPIEEQPNEDIVEINESSHEQTIGEKIKNLFS